MSAESLHPDTGQAIESYDIKGSVYSWGKTGRTRTEKFFMEVYDAIPGDIHAVDLGSSYPHYREIMTGQHRQRLITDSKRFANMFMTALHGPRKYGLKKTSELGHDDLKRVKDLLVPKHGNARQLLNTAVYSVMLNPPSDSKRDIASVSDALFGNFSRSREKLVEIIEPDGTTDKVKGNWKFITKEDGGITLFQLIESVLDADTTLFLREAANYIADAIISGYKLRRVDFVSLDNMPFNVIVEEAGRGFPPRMKGTRFFASAQKTDRHVQADILRPPFKPGSVEFYAAIESWPYYFRRGGLPANLSIARQIADTLAPEGKAVFFPWQMDPHDRTAAQWLEAIEKEWNKSGLKIEKESLTADEMRKGMTDREFVLSQHSPLFRYLGVLTTLTLSKPI